MAIVLFFPRQANRRLIPWRTTSVRLRRVVRKNWMVRSVRVVQLVNHSTRGFGECVAGRQWCPRVRILPPDRDDKTGFLELPKGLARACLSAPYTRGKGRDRRPRLAGLRVAERPQRGIGRHGVRPEARVDQADRYHGERCDRLRGVCAVGHVAPLCPIHWSIGLCFLIGYLRGATIREAHQIGNPEPDGPAQADGGQDS